jgi:regulator of ribonuclease activity B
MGDVRPIRTREDLAREHFFYFPVKADAEIVAVRLRDRGWTAQVALGADDVNWLVFAREPDPVRDMGELWDELVTLAEQFNGEYDGYGSQA